MVSLHVAHIADSVLSNGSCKNGKTDNTWLGVANMDVQTGRSFTRHEWEPPASSASMTVIVHCSGNDLKKSGPTVKGALDCAFWSIFERKLGEIQSKSREVIFVMWGDYDAWQSGFVDAAVAPARTRYDDMCMSMLQAASGLGVHTLWLRSRHLSDLARPDGWHFEASAREGLRRILASICIVTRGLPPAPSAPPAPPAPPVPPAGPPAPKSFADHCGVGIGAKVLFLAPTAERWQQLEANAEQPPLPTEPPPETLLWIELDAHDDAPMARRLQMGLLFCSCPDRSSGLLDAATALRRAFCED